MGSCNHWNDINTSNEKRQKMNSLLLADLESSVSIVRGKLYKLRQRLEKVREEEKEFISEVYFKPKKFDKEGTAIGAQRLEQIAKTPMNLSLVALKWLDRRSLMLVILQREKLLLDTIEEFNQDLKHNDREIFKTLQKEIKRLDQYLLDNHRGYGEYIDLKRRMVVLKKEYRNEKARLRARNMIIWHKNEKLMLDISKLEKKKKVKKG